MKIAPFNSIKRLCTRIRAWHEALNRTRQITRLYELRAIAVRCGAHDVAAALDAEIDLIAAGGAR